MRKIIMLFFGLNWSLKTQNSQVYYQRQFSMSLWFLEKECWKYPFMQIFRKFRCFYKKTVSISFFPLCTIVSRFYLILDLYKSLKTKTLLLTTKFLATKMFDFLSLISMCLFRVDLDEISVTSVSHREFWLLLLGWKTKSSIF